MKPTLADTVYEKLRDAIINGEMVSGEILLEQMVAQRYGISKVTAREILQRLCGGKYLVSYPRKGYLINEITAYQAKQLQRVRYQVEAFAMREIIKRCTDEQIATLLEILNMEQTGSDPYDTINSRFHMRVAELSGSPYVFDSMYSFMGPICRYAITNSRQGGFSAEDSRHPAIIEALLKRDVPAALENLRIDLQLKPDEV